MSNLFYGCKKLKFFPDISKWNTNNVNNISNLFNGCKEIKILPDISEWNTSNIINMNNLFYSVKIYIFYLIFQNGKLIM